MISKFTDVTMRSPYLDMATPPQLSDREKELQRREEEIRQMTVSWLFLPPLYETHSDRFSGSACVLYELSVRPA